MLVVGAVKEEVTELGGIPLGIGPLRAGQAMAARLAVHRPTAVVWVGTAGTYGGKLARGTVVQAGRMGWRDGGAELGFGYVPAAPSELHADEALAARLNLPQVATLTLAAITTDRSLVAKLGLAWDIEVMEVYAVALACADAGVPFAAVLGITNDVGPEAHAEWLTWRGRAESAAQAAVRSALLG